MQYSHSGITPLENSTPESLLNHFFKVNAKNWLPLQCEHKQHYYWQCCRVYSIKAIQLLIMDYSLKGNVIIAFTTLLMVINYSGQIIFL